MFDLVDRTKKGFLNRDVLASYFKDEVPTFGENKIERVLRRLSSAGNMRIGLDDFRSVFITRNVKSHHKT